MKILFPFTGTRIGGAVVSATLLQSELSKVPETSVITLIPDGRTMNIPQATEIQSYLGANGIPFLYNSLDEDDVLYIRGSKPRSPYRYFEILKKCYSSIKCLDFDLMHVNDDRTLMTFGVAARFLRKPVIWHVRQEQGSLLRDPIKQIISSRMILVCNQNKSRFPLGTFRKLNVVYNGVDLSNCSHQPRSDMESPRPINLGFVGSLVSRKRPYWFVNAAITLKNEGIDVMAYIAGDGPMKDELEKYVADNGAADFIQFLGFIDHPHTLYKSLNVLALPSERKGEAFPRVVIEAMAHGVVPVATRVAGVPEAIADMETGMLTDADDYSDFLEKLRIVVKSPDIRRSLSKQASAFARDHFCSTKTCSQVVQIYRQLLRN